MKRCILGGLLSVWQFTAQAVVLPLPPVPENSSATNPATTTTAAKNSPASQALIDQLFDQATYGKFAPQTATELSFEDQP